MPLSSSAEQPLPLRTVARAIGDWIGRLGRVWVEGQVTQLGRRPGAAVTFLTLRDPVAEVSVQVTCRGDVIERCTPPLSDGARVVLWAKPTFYLGRGTLSLEAFDIRPVGLGELLARIERLKTLLAAEGLFAAERKRPLPFLPHVVGLVCGRASAAEHDVLENAKRRWPAVRFRVETVAVQGPSAAMDVANAVRRLDKDADVDVIVVARGGGSIEDLLPFSDEALCRVVADCRTPIVSAIGHEQDSPLIDLVADVDVIVVARGGGSIEDLLPFSDEALCRVVADCRTPIVSAIGHEQDSPLIDLVADVRASTPTDAGKRVVPDVAEQVALIDALRQRARRAVAHRLDSEKRELAALRARPVLADPMRDVHKRAEDVRALRGRALRCATAAVDAATADLVHTRARVRALSPAATLDRGYAVVQRADGSVVRDAADVAVADALAVRLAAGRLGVEVTTTDG